MVELVHMIASFVGLLSASKYGLLFFGSFFEGSVAMITGGLLLRIGEVTFWPMYAALFLGDVLADITYYGIGYFGARKAVIKYGKYINLTPQLLEKVETKFHQEHTKILIVSKLTMGLGFATAILTTAGMLRISFVRFLTINILCGVVWVTFLVGIGYYFGNILSGLPKNVQIAGVFGMVIVFFVAIKLISSYLARTEWK